MKNTILIGIIFLFISLQAKAQIPANYWDGTAGLTGDALKNKLNQIITANHSAVGYSGLWNAYSTTDVYSEDNNKVWDMYSSYGTYNNWAYVYTIGSDQCGTYTDENQCYNREHSFPKSWWGGSKDKFDDENDKTKNSTQYSDLFHVVPTDGYVNNQRGNLAYGEVSSPTWTSLNGSKKGPNSYPGGFTGTAFEPIDEYKGDLARGIFYMATRYPVGSWAAANSDEDISKVFNTDGTFKANYYQMLYQWHINDPVSQKEIDRNNAVYDIQHNANPYISHPEWVCEVFGNCINVVQNPGNLTAIASSESQINLSWSLNDDNNDVVLAYSTTNTFGVPTGTYTVGQTISGGGEVLYVGNSTTFNHAGLSNQIYYYKLWSVNSTPEYSSGIVTQATPLTPEPSNHVTNFVVSVTTANTISLTWTDATGTNLPDAYLIKASTDVASIVAPSDGTPESDAAFVQNINYGTETATFTGLSENTQYYFKIYPYSNSAANIDFKTDGSIPEANGTTLENTSGNIVITEVAGKGYNQDYNDEYIEITNVGCTDIDLTNYTLEYYESASPEADLDLTGTITAGNSYVIAVRTTYSAITPDFVPGTGFHINNPFYVLLKENSEIVDQAGSDADKFDDANNYKFTNCTDDNEPTANWTNLVTENGTPGVYDCAVIPPTNVNSLNANCSYTTSQVSWINPTCFDEIILVASESSISGTPLGTYTANSLSYTDVLNPDFPDGGKVVYNGTGNNVTVSDLSEGVSYYFKVYTRSDDLWSTGAEISCNTLISGVDDVENLVVLYPNPTKGKLSLSYKKTNLYRISISDISGKSIYKKECNQRNIELDLTGFAKGIYFISIETQEINIRKKIIIK